MRLSGDLTCVCLPPSDLLGPSGGNPKYWYQSGPCGTELPIMPDYFLHLLKDTTCITTDEKDVFERLPDREHNLNVHERVDV
jgi:hypothetical protein